MATKKYSVEVTVHRQSNRAWTHTHVVEVGDTGNEEADKIVAKHIAEAHAEESAANIDFNQFSESSVHYETEVENIETTPV